MKGYHWAIPGTRAELREEEQVCLTCPLPECNEDDPACPYKAVLECRHVEVLGARIRRNAMRQAIRLALREVE